MVDVPANMNPPAPSNGDDLVVAFLRARLAVVSVYGKQFQATVCV